MSRELTANWLRQNIVRYQHADRVYADVLAALDRYPSMRPKTDVYTFDDGRTQLLLCVHGLLPISFRNASYNIPVAVWLVVSYPSDAPLAYVVPTSDMLVKPSAQVDHSGRCNLEYLAHWHRKPEGCSIVALLEAMQSHFSQEPPLYAKTRPKAPDGPSRVASLGHSSPSAAHRTSPPDRGHVSDLGESSAPPRLPPKPFSPGPGAGVTPSSISNVLGSVPTVSFAPSSPSSLASRSQTHTSDNSSRATGAEVRNSRPPPVPPHPPEPYPISGPISSSASPPCGHSPNAQGPPPYVSASPPVPPRPTVTPSPFAPQGGTSFPPIERGQAPAITPAYAPPHPYSQPPPIHPQPHHPAPISAPVLYPVQQYGTESGYQHPSVPPTLQAAEPQRPPPALPPPDLLDEDEGLNTIQPTSTISADAAPPRPPNPQTVALHNALLTSFRDALSRLATTHADALARQRAAQAELLAGPEAIRDESARLAAVRDVCRVVGDRWGALISEGERALSEMRRRGEVSVDEMVCASSIVGNQLVNLVAEDNAIEDTIYHLHRALNSGRIDLERFLRTTRVLAEEQFMKRALAEKILRGLPMGMAMR